LILSLKVAFVLFYTAFLSIYIFITGLMGISVLNIESQTLTDIPQAPPDPNLLAALTYLFDLAVFGVRSFAVLLTVSTEFLFLTVFLFTPLSIAMLWAIIELARGN